MMYFANVLKCGEYDRHIAKQEEKQQKQQRIAMNELKLPITRHTQPTASTKSITTTNKIDETHTRSASLFSTYVSSNKVDSTTIENTGDQLTMI